MIPRANITAWRPKAPWSTDAQVEQDLVLSRALVEIFSDPTVSAAFAGRGGTILHKLYFDPPGRYSEDIDLVQVEAGPIGPALNALRNRIDPWLGEPGFERRRDSVKLMYRFESEIEPVVRLRLKIEINTREHFAVYGFRPRPFSVDNPWFAGTAMVVTYGLEELLATKMRALFQRKKGRDLFDLATALACYPELNLDRVVSCFLEYFSRAGASVTRAQFEVNLTRKERDPNYGADVGPLLTQGTGALGAGVSDASEFDPAGAFKLVRDELMSRLPGRPWKGNVR